MLADVFDHCSVSWPPQRWLAFHCPGCREDWKVALSAGTVSIGDIDGAPGPCFIPSDSVAAPDLQVAVTSSGITVKHAGRRWRFPAR